MSDETSTVDNGVNVKALLEAKEALTDAQLHEVAVQAKGLVECQAVIGGGRIGDDREAAV